MFSKRELLDAIAECEKTPQSYQDCEKLATFYTLYDHLFPTDSGGQDGAIIGEYGDTDFLREISGCSAEKVSLIIDDLMSTLKSVQPRLYDTIMTRITQSK